MEKPHEFWTFREIYPPFVNKNCDLDFCKKADLLYINTSLCASHNVIPGYSLVALNWESAEQFLHLMLVWAWGWLKAATAEAVRDFGKHLSVLPAVLRFISLRGCERGGWHFSCPLSHDISRDPIYHRPRALKCACICVYACVRTKVLCVFTCVCLCSPWSRQSDPWAGRNKLEFLLYISQIDCWRQMNVIWT